MPTAAEVTAYWDTTASTFDTEPDHGLAAPAVRGAWSQRLREWIPDASADVLDVGCGTGSLSLVLAGHGHRVTGVDLSPNMVALAQRKLGVAGHPASIMLGDASQPPVGGLRLTSCSPGTCCGRCLIHRPPCDSGSACSALAATSSWSKDAGAPRTTAPRPRRAPPRCRGGAVLRPTSWLRHSSREHLTDPLLWGREIHDERYVLLAHI
jgi:SAM-dependent methyltransferase